MKRRYIMEIGQYSPLYYYYAYFDTDEYLADFLFHREEVDVTVEEEYWEEEEMPFHIVQCRVPKAQRAAFLRAIDDLPDWMNSLGRTGYDEYCHGFLRRAAEYRARKAAAEVSGRSGNIPLQ